MAPTYLPRVPAFPIVGEKSVLTVLGTGLQLPATVNDQCPLIGKQAPEINLPDHLGRRCSLRATIALGRPIILFFFPLAGSPHCTKESCGFRDALGLTPIFIDFQAIVIGISQDPPSRSRRFVDEHKLGYRILHDERRQAMETYGVARTWMGLIDQRCTFVIDPNGIVRSMIQGVLNADAHIMFAEKWLIRLEHELSQRARIMTALESPPEELMLDPAAADALVKMRIAYGDMNSASMGGIDAAPRYGAASLASNKVPKSPLRRAAQSSDHEHDDPQREKNGKDKNMWKQWKTLFQQLSSPDDQPPPMVMARMEAASMLASSSSSSSPIRERDGSTRSKSSSATAAAPTLTRTKSSGRLKDLGKNLRRGSASASAASHDASVADPFMRSIGLPNSHDTSRTMTTDQAIPPVPRLFAATTESNGTYATHEHAASPRAPSSGLESESSDRDASTWGTDSSLSSHVSTAATSAMGSGTRHGLTNGGVLMPNANHFVFAKPSVTSEVLMPGDVLDLSKGPPPVVVRAIPAQAPPPLGVAPMHPTQSSEQRAHALRKPVPALPLSAGQNGDANASRNNTGGVAGTPQPPVRPNRRTSGTASLTSPTVARHADVPQDELEEDALAVSSARPMARDGLRTGHTNAATLLEDSLGANSRSNTPQIGSSAGFARAMQHDDDDDNAYESTTDAALINERRNSASLQSLRAQRHRSASITDGVYRIQTPTLADAAEPANVPEIGSSLSPRPRSVTPRDAGRLRRPMAAPRDHVVELAHRASQMSMADSYESERSSSPKHNVGGRSPTTNGGGASTPVLDQNAATIQRAVRKASLRGEAPKPADRPRVISMDRSQPSTPTRRASMKATTATPNGTVATGDVTASPPTIVEMEATSDSPLQQTFASSGLPPPQPPQKSSPSQQQQQQQITPLLAALDDFAQRNGDNDMRRPSVSSMGTFGRRGSTD